MDTRGAIIAYNDIVQVVPSLKGADVIDFCSLTDVISNLKPFSFKVSLIPNEQSDLLKNFDSTTFDSTIDIIDEYLRGYIKQIGFYPKFNTTFERYIHVPIMDTSSLNITNIDIESVFQIPIQVIFYRYYNNNVSTIKRYFNSSIYFDHTAYMLIPSCILSSYTSLRNYETFSQNTPTIAYSYPDIQNYGIDFSNANNFQFVIDDEDILAQSRHIAFVEIIFNVTSVYNYLKFYTMIKDGSSVYLRAINAKSLSYRKAFYNMDFMNIKNKIIKRA